MASGIIPIFKHLLKLCVFFLNTINITLVGDCCYVFLSFLRRKREKREKRKREKRKKKKEKREKEKREK